MNTLFINTSTVQTSIALYEGNEVFAQKQWPAEQNESEALKPAVDELLNEQGLSPDDIDQLLVCVGPGGFTSARVGVSAVNAWAFAQNIPVAEVSAFDLFPSDESILFVVANKAESWMMTPNSDAVWVNVEELKLPESFSFSGILNDEWREFLESSGGSFVDAEETVPSLEGLTFSKKIVEPWYYKDPNITWSSKISPNN
jgi:tRNA threonylcarbamoyl adenosine modification protein YeaZ